MSHMKPTTLQEAVTAIRGAFPASELEDWAAQPAHLAVGYAHFGLGLWIRNEWVHDGGSPLADRLMQKGWPFDPDKVSSLISTALWSVLNGQQCPTLDELLAPYELGEDQ